MSEERSNLNIALESIEALNDFRYRMQTVFFDNLNNLMGENTPDLLKNGTTRLSDFSKKEIEMEKELMSQVKNFFNNRNAEETDGDSSEEVAEKDEIKSAVANKYHTINIPSNTKEFSVPINLNNHYDQKQVVTIDITPLQEKGGVTIIVDQFKVENREVTLEAKSTKKVIATLYDTSLLKEGKEYISEIFIGGKKPYVIPVMFRIIENKELEISVTESEGEPIED